MAFRTNSSRNHPANLTIRPPSPGPSHQPSVSTPTNLFPPSNAQGLISPRRAPLPPSPTYSLGHPAPWMEEHRSRGGSLDIPRDRPPPVPSKSERDKRLPLPPVITNFGQGEHASPRKPHKGGYAGAYDNKLVTSTLSHLPALPPLSPTPTGSSSNVSQASNHGLAPASSSSYTTALHTVSARPSFSSPSSTLVLPNGTALPTKYGEHDRSYFSGHDSGGAGVGRSVIETLAHSSPSSPWSLLTVHALPLFAGGPLRTPIEDLNQLCHSHIIATSQRAQASRIVAVLSSDFREFVASGMLTLKAKFETLEESKVVARAAEVWSFFWAQVLPYLEGVFLPFTQVRDLPSSSTHPATLSSPIPVRHILLSGFLLHILLPLLPRLHHLIVESAGGEAMRPASDLDLQRILQMSLALSTQARYSTFMLSQERADVEVRTNVEGLGNAVRWRMSKPAEEARVSPAKKPSTDSTGSSWSNNRVSLQRGPSMNQGRLRRKGWRASSQFGQLWGPPSQEQTTRAGMPRQYSDASQIPEQRWGKPRDDEEDDDGGDTPGQSLASTMGSTVTAGTLRG